MAQARLQALVETYNERSETFKQENDLEQLDLCLPDDTGASSYVINLFDEIRNNRENLKYMKLNRDRVDNFEVEELMDLLDTIEKEASAVNI